MISRDTPPFCLLQFLLHLVFHLLLWYVVHHLIHLLHLLRRTSLLKAKEYSLTTVLKTPTNLLIPLRKSSRTKMHRDSYPRRFSNEGQRFTFVLIKFTSGRKFRSWMRNSSRNNLWGVSQKWDHNFGANHVSKINFDYRLKLYIKLNHLDIYLLLIEIFIRNEKNSHTSLWEKIENSWKIKKSII